MDDVVGQGQDERQGPPRWLRRGALAGALVLGALLLTRPHLLSAGPPRPDPAPSQSATTAAVRGPNTSQGVSIVVRKGNRLERYEAGSGRRPLAALPAGLPAAASFVHVGRLDGTGPLLGVTGSVLFRASPVRGRAVASIGRAQRVVGPSPTPGRVLVVAPFGGPGNGRRLVELDARSGAVTDERPYPGYDATGPWQAAGVVDLLGQSALLLTRPAEAGVLDLALAWDRASVGRDGVPALREIGRTRRLLGVAQNRILTIDRPSTCVDGGCPITVLTVTVDRVLSRPVDPPPGWSYGSTVVSGDDGDPLVVVAHVGDPLELGLARLAAGGSRGLLIAGSQDMVGSIAPVGGSQGSVVFAVPRPEGLRLAVWRPGARAAALLLDLPALEEGSKLVCACR